MAYCSACTPRQPPLPPPTAVQNGQLYVSGQTEFDGLFRELNDIQLQLHGANDEERSIRKSLAKALAMDDGATRQLLTDKVNEFATALAGKKIRLKLEVEGLDADDAADTMAQTKVIGSLDGEAQTRVESTTLAARQELRFAAQLRHTQKRLERLAQHAAALEPWVDSTFAQQGQTKVAEVKRNLGDARQQFPLLSLRASSLAEEARRTVQRLSAALTTDASIGSLKELPLIAPTEPPPAAPKRQPQRAASGSAPAKKPAAPAPKNSDATTPDFEP
jgi:hypothetical protein